ncbi:MAG: ankyrin repeat domain-containing protein [Treponemataceae bacterium]|nr:ankyrin repeat domain-containing protein [Treponemataceae bacterium]
MKGVLALRKSALVAAVCLAVLCLPGYSEPTPEQIAERTRLLKQAIENNNLEQAKVCIKLGADVNAKDDNGMTVLMTAAIAGNTDIAELLIKAGAEMHVEGDNGLTALMTAAYSGNKDTAELLIKAGADMNAKNNDGLTALMYAVHYEQKDTADLLIKLGANPNATDRRNWSALSYAMVTLRFTYNRTIAEQLIKAGADSDAALIWAVKTVPHPSDVVKLLIELGADVNATDSDGLTALTCAILYGQNEVADLLRAAGATE